MIVPAFMYTGTVAEPTVAEHAVGVPELKYIGLADPPIVVEPNLDAAEAVDAFPEILISQVPLAPAPVLSGY